MKSPNINTKRGFTIIEVVLVLAIAGLIFLMVFIALPNMQSSQRNTARRNDYSSLSTMVTSYVGNNNGKMPVSKKVKGTWLNANGTDPDGEPYITLNSSGENSDSATVKDCPATGGCGHRTPKRNTQQFQIITSATCTDGTPTYKKGIRNFVIYAYIEDGANTDGTYCLASNA